VLFCSILFDKLAGVADEDERSDQGNGFFEGSLLGE
jgi:hypothetical protein